MSGLCIQSPVAAVLVTHGGTPIKENSRAIHTSFPPITSKVFPKILSDSLSCQTFLLGPFGISFPPARQRLLGKQFPVLCQYLRWHLIPAILA